MKRRTSAFITFRIDEIFEKYEVNDKKFHLHFVDVTDYGYIFDLISKIMPYEVYNLATTGGLKNIEQLLKYARDIGASCKRLIITVFTDAALRRQNAKRSTARCHRPQE